jgi:uncharacterized protein YukE
MPASDLVGVNLAQMAELQQTFEARAGQIEELIAAISNLVGSSGGPGAVYWMGKLADEFRGEWDAVYVKNLRQLVEALHAQARYVNDNRRRSNLVLNGIDA